MGTTGTRATGAELLDLASVKSQIWDPGTPQLTDTTFDNLISGMIDDIVGEAEKDVGLKMNAVTAQVQYGTVSEKYIWLEYMNVSNVSVWIDPTKQFNPGILVDPARYDVHSLRGYIERHIPTRTQQRERYETPLDFSSSDWWGMDYALAGGGFPHGDRYNTLKVQYDGGFSSSTLEKALKRALTKQVVYEFRRRKDPGLSSVRFPDGSIEKFSTEKFLPEVQAVFDEYRRIRL
jgi:hypothetical protein